MIWKTVKSFFTDNIKTKSKITLIEKNCLPGRTRGNGFRRISEDQTLGEVFNKLFINIAPNLKISTDHGYDNDIIATDDKVTNADNMLRNHPSIIMIKNKKEKMI